MAVGDFVYIALSGNNYFPMPKEELKKLVLADKYFLGRHFFEYATLFQLQKEEALLTEEEFESVKNRLSPDCCYVESYPMSDFLGGEDIKINGDTIPVFLLEFLISKPKNYFSLQKFILDWCKGLSYVYCKSVDDENCVMDYFDLDMAYLNQIHEGIRELYKKLTVGNYKLSNENEDFFKLFSERKTTGQNLLFLTKYVNLDDYNIEKEEFIKSFDPRLVDGVIELLKRKDITKEEIKLYLKEHNSLIGFENYIFLIKKVKDISKPILEYDENLDKNIDEIFYNSNVHYCFYPMLGNAIEEDEIMNDLGEEMQGDLDDSILNYVFENLPDDLNGKEELAFCLYVLLGDVLQYDAAYLLDKKRKLNWMKDLTMDNNKAICRAWAASYCKLLEHYGMKSYIDGYEHLSVLIPVDYTMYEADATRIVDGFSDLASIKLNFYPQAFIVDRVSSYSTEEKIFRKKKLEEIKESVFKKLGRKAVSKKEAYKRAEKSQALFSKYLAKKNGIFTKDDFDKIVRYFNRLYKPFAVGADIERGELFNRYIDMAIYEFPSGCAESIPIYRINDNDVSYANLLCMKDCNNEIHVYLENEVGFESSSGEDILEDVAAGKLVFRDPDLYEKVKMFYKKPNEVVSNTGVSNK